MPATTRASCTSTPKPSGRRWIVRVVSIALIAAAAWGVVRWGLARSKASKPSVILISIDTCRADYIGCYNPNRAITPNIDALSEQATLFVNAAAPTPMTLPSHTSMLTGRIPLVHGVYDNGQIVPSANQMLAEVLKAEGYATAGFVSSAVFAQALAQYRAAAELLANRQDDPLAATLVEAIERLEKP